MSLVGVFVPMFRECSFTSLHSQRSSGNFQDHVFVPMFRECSFTCAQHEREYWKHDYQFSSLCLGNVLSQHDMTATTLFLMVAKVFVPMFRECSFTTLPFNFSTMTFHPLLFSSLCLGNVLSLIITVIQFGTVERVFVPMFRECSFTMNDFDEVMEDVEPSCFRPYV